MITEEEQSKLIGEAISAAVCIDDELIAPYEKVDNEANYQLSKDLYESFSSDGKCSLDIYRFINYETYVENEERILKNKDLVILDWELYQNQECKYKDTLMILDRLCFNQQIKFINIYTHVEDLQGIVTEIYAFFLKAHERRKQILTVKDVIINILDENGLEADKVVDSWRTYGLNYIFCFGKQEGQGRYKEFCSKIRLMLEEIEASENYRRICQSINMNLKDNSFKDLQEYLFWYSLLFLSASELSSNNKFICSILTETALLINGTVIYVTHKDQINKHDLYNKLIVPISTLPNQRLIYLSLLLKTIVCEKVSLFSKELGKLDENTLRHHCNDVFSVGGGKENIVSFISFLMQSQTAAMFADAVDPDYLARLMLFEEGESDTYDKKEMIKTDSFITFTPLSHIITSQHQVRPGDVFKIEPSIGGKDEVNGSITDVELTHILCITQSCDALRPHKVNNNLAFVLGKEAEQDRALTDAERFYFTYLPPENDLKTLEWKKQFVTLFVENTLLNKVAEQFSFQFFHNGTQHTATLIGTQKEQPTLRIINNVFSNAMRIGIDLPHHH